MNCNSLRGSKIESWVSKSEKKCKNRRWPLNWLCWFVTFLVKVITWVSKRIWKFVIKVVCEIISLIIHPFAVAIAVIIDAICQKCNALYNVNSTFGSEGKCKFTSKNKSTIKPNQFDYSFVCNCKKKESKFTVTAPNDKIAIELARSIKLKKCGIKNKVSLETVNVLQSPIIMFEYTFLCHCKNSQFPKPIKLTFPPNIKISIVKAKAKKECNKLC